MNRVNSNNCFYKNGKKILKKKISNFYSKEEINSLSSALINENIFSIAGGFEDTKNVKRDAFFKLKRKSRNVFKKIGSKIDKTNIKAGVTGVWASFSIVAIFAFVTSIMTIPQKAVPQDTTKYSIYSSKPLTIKTTTASIYSRDSRAQKINAVYKIYNCPLEGMGDVMVYEADKNNIPWWLVAAISFQESGCGKKTPKTNGVESYNAWGWGVYGDYVFSFDNWVRGIETVSKYLSDKFYSQGVTDTCEIMKIYTPPSKGSWCEGVNHFGDTIQNYETPLN